MSESLYNLVAGFNTSKEILKSLDIDEKTILDTLESMECDIVDKVQGITVITSEMASEAEYIDKQIKRMQERKKAVEGRINSIKTYLQTQMELLGKEKIKTPDFSVSIRNNPPAVQITDEAAIPSQFLTIIPAQYVPDKTAIKNALKAGEQVPGCELTQGRRLDIR